MKKTLLSIVAVAVITIWAVVGNAQNASEYLVCQDIGAFKKYGCACGSGAGILVPADHFGEDHNDISCNVTYHSMAQRLAVKVEVTKHAGGDSDKWLLHEVEDGYRDPDVLEANWTQGARVRNINGNLIFGVRGSGYTWLSGHIVVNIEYTDLTGTKPEPLEVIQAYLQKFPSSITLTDAEAKSKTHSETWLKDEMERRLWLCDKWFYQLQLGKVQQNDAFQAAVKSMNVFLDYREKYYGIKAADEKNLLAGYLNTNNGTGIKAKLTEYKNWWAVNKTGNISL